MRYVTSFLMMLSLVCSVGNTNPVIVPKPKKLSWDGGVLSVPEAVKINHLYDQGDNRIALAMDKVLKQLGTHEDKEGTPLILGTMANDEASLLAKSFGLRVPSQAEGYALTIQPDKILIVGRDMRGLFYGIQTLRQLVLFHTDGAKFPRVHLSDYPTLKNRGIHCYTGKDALPEQLHLVDFMAEHKFNTLVIQVEHMQFNSHPEIFNERYGQSQEEVRKWVEYARENYLDVVPVLPSLSHMFWLYHNGQNQDLLEDPASKENYCPSNPRSYEVMFGLFDEVMDVFQPTTFHLGHDEVNHTSVFPYCEKCKPFSVTELFNRDLDKLFSYFEGKDINLMLWSDMFLADGYYTDADNAENRKEAKLRRDHIKTIWKKYNIPKVTIYDWHYAAAEPKDFVSIDLWRKEGFPVVAATWDNSTNIRNFTLKTIQEGGEGLTQTTWAGFTFSIKNNIHCHDQFAAYLLASDYSWSGRTEPVEDLPYNYRERFWNGWYGARYGQANRQFSLEKITPDIARRIMRANQETRLVSQQETDDGVILLSFQHNLYNPFDQPLKITIDYQAIPGGGEKTDILSAREDKEIVQDIRIKKEHFKAALNIRIPIRIILPDGQSVEFLSIVHPSLRWKAPARTDKIKIDGNLDDWNGKPVVILNDRECVEVKKEWSAEDLNVKAWACHDRKYLYLAWEVEDNVHHNKVDKIRDLWQGDSVQFAIDFQNNKSVNCDFDDLEAGFALIDGKCEASIYHPAGKTAWPYLKKIKWGIEQEGNLTRYEVRVPLNLRIKRKSIGDQIGFSFVVNDNDGSGFTGGMVAAHGIYHRKEPRLYGILELE